MASDADIAAAERIRSTLGLDQLEADAARFRVSLAAYLRWPEPPSSPAPAGKSRPNWLRSVISGGREKLKLFS